MFVFMSVVVTVWGSVGMFVVKRPLIKIECFSLQMVKYGCDGCFVFCFIVMHGAVCTQNGKNKCFDMQKVYVCVVCAYCGSSQCCVLHDLQFVNAGRRCKRLPYGSGILQSRSHDCLVGNHDGSFCLPHPVAGSAFIISIAVCACTEML